MTMGIGRDRSRDRARGLAGKGGGRPALFVLAAPALLTAAAKRASFEAPIVETEPDRVAEVVNQGLPVVPLEHGVDAEPGRPTRATPQRR